MQDGAPQDTSKAWKQQLCRASAVALVALLSVVAAPGASARTVRHAGVLATLPERLAGKPLQITHDQHTLSLHLHGARDVRGRRAKGGVSYSGVFKGVDSRVEVSRAGLKEELVLRRRAAPRAFTYQMRVSPELVLRSDALGGISADSTNGGAVFGIAPAFAYDRAGRRFRVGTQIRRRGQSSYDVTYIIKTQGVRPRLPLILDPTVTVPPTQPFGVQQGGRLEALSCTFSATGNASFAFTGFQLFTRPPGSATYSATGSGSCAGRPAGSDRFQAAAPVTVSMDGSWSTEDTNTCHTFAAGSSLSGQVAVNGPAVSLAEPLTTRLNPLFETTTASFGGQSVSGNALAALEAPCDSGRLRLWGSFTVFHRAAPTEATVDQTPTANEVPAQPPNPPNLHCALPPGSGVEVGQTCLPGPRAEYKFEAIDPSKPADKVKTDCRVILQAATPAPPLGDNSNGYAQFRTTAQCDQALRVMQISNRLVDERGSERAVAPGFDCHILRLGDECNTSPASSEGSAYGLESGRYTQETIVRLVLNEPGAHDPWVLAPGTSPQGNSCQVVDSGGGLRTEVTCALFVPIVIDPEPPAIDCFQANLLNPSDCSRPQDGPEPTNLGDATSPDDPPDEELAEFPPSEDALQCGPGDVYLTMTPDYLEEKGAATTDGALATFLALPVVPLMSPTAFTKVSAGDTSVLFQGVGATGNILAQIRVEKLLNEQFRVYDFAACSDFYTPVHLPQG